MFLLLSTCILQENLLIFFELKDCTQQYMTTVPHEIRQATFNGFGSAE